MPSYPTPEFDAREEPDPIARLEWVRDDLATWESDSAHFDAREIDIALREILAESPGYVRAAHPAPAAPPEPRTRPMAPRFQSATARRDARRQVRGALGPSSEDAPGPEAAIAATAALQRLLDLATDGALLLDIIDTRTGAVLQPAEARTLARGPQS
jgi:hypothetical protein